MQISDVSVQFSIAVIAAIFERMEGIRPDIGMKEDAEGAAGGGIYPLAGDILLSHLRRRARHGPRRVRDDQLLRIDDDEASCAKRAPPALRASRIDFLGCGSGAAGGGAECSSAMAGSASGEGGGSTAAIGFCSAGCVAQPSSTPLMAMHMAPIATKCAAFLPKWTGAKFTGAKFTSDWRFRVGSATRMRTCPSLPSLTVSPERETSLHAACVAYAASLCPSVALDQPMSQKRTACRSDRPFITATMVPFPIFCPESSPNATVKVRNLFQKCFRRFYGMRGPRTRPKKFPADAPSII